MNMVTQIHSYTYIHVFVLKPTRTHLPSQFKNNAHPCVWILLYTDLSVSRLISSRPWIF